MKPISTLIVLLTLAATVALGFAQDESEERIQLGGHTFVENGEVVEVYLKLDRWNGQTQRLAQADDEKGEPIAEPEGAKPGASEFLRYELACYDFVKEGIAKQVYVRFDRASGRAWTVSGQSPWKLIAEPKERANSADSSFGRYQLGSHNYVLANAALEVYIRMDTVSGQAWKYDAVGQAKWEPLTEPKGDEKLPAGEKARYRLYVENVVRAGKDVEHYFRVDQHTDRLWEWIGTEAGWRVVANNSPLAGRWVQSFRAFNDDTPDATQMIYGRQFKKDDPLALYQNRALLQVRDGEFMFMNGRHYQRVKVTLDPAANPPTVDIWLDMNKKILGIYERKKNVVTLALGDDKQRPKSFDSTVAEKTRLLVQFQTLRSMLFPQLEDSIGLLSLAHEPVIRTEIGFDITRAARVKAALAPVRARYEERIDQLLAEFAPNEAQTKFLEVRAEFHQEVGKVLEETLPRQSWQRLRQLELQKRGLSAFRDQAIQKTLDLTPEQLARTDQLEKELQEQMRKKATFSAEVFQQMRAKLDADMLAVLTEVQRTKWKELLGPAFDFGYKGDKGAGEKK